MQVVRPAYFLTHPIQYQSPLIRHLRSSGLDLHVVYGNDATARTYHDSGFGRELTWDMPLLEGYPNTVLNSSDPNGSTKEQRAYFARQIGALMDQERIDAAWVHGWSHPFTQAAWAEATRRKIPLMLRGETFLGCVRGGWLRRKMHRMVFSRKFREISAFLAVGTLNHRLYRAYGVPEERIFPVPYVVDNVFFQSRAADKRPNRENLRAELGIEAGRLVVLFCGKLIDVKDPATLIRAMSRFSGRPNSAKEEDCAPVLLVAGDGRLRPELEELAGQIAPGRVKFLGFRNQTDLPALYDLCDLFVLPSVFEPWGLVVNEVMNAGRPVIVSDMVGAGPDLVKPGINGDVFQAGNVEDLAARMRPWLEDADLRTRGGWESLRIVNGWGFDQSLAGLQAAINTLNLP